jgi:hypothetical protein
MHLVSPYYAKRDMWLVEYLPTFRKTVMPSFSSVKKSKESSYFAWPLQDGGNTSADTRRLMVVTVQRHVEAAFQPQALSPYIPPTIKKIMFVWLHSSSFYMYSHCYLFFIII